MAWGHLSPRIAPIPEIPGIPVCAACDRVLVRLEGIAARISVDIAARIDIDTSTSIDIDDRPRLSARGRNLRGRGWPRAWWPDFLLALTYRLHEAGKQNASPERLS